MPPDRRLKGPFVTLSLFPTVLRNSLSIAPFFVLFLAGVGQAQPAKITIVYPKPEYRMPAVDSTFILGNVTSSARQLADLSLTVNGVSTQIYPDGGWLGWVPVKPGRFPFVVKVHEAKSLRVLAIDSVVVTVAEIPRSIPSDSLALVGDYRPPRGDLVLLTGDEHRISVRATPGAAVWAKMSGIADSLPLYERSVYGQAYWGANVFGSSNQADTSATSGIYTNVLRVTDSMHADTAHIDYFFTKLFSRSSSDITVKDVRKGTPSRLPVDSTLILSAQSSYRISLNPTNYPMTVMFADTIQTIRHAPQAGYFSIYQPMGIIAKSIGAEGAWQKLQLSPTQIAWASGASLDTLPFGTPLPQSQPSTIRTYNLGDSVVIECVLSGRHPFRIQERDHATLVAELFGVTSNIDWIRYDYSDSLVETIQWSQPEPEDFSFEINTSQAIWGYDAYYRGTTFVVVLHRPPSDLAHIKGKRIVVDPGHSADPGSIGPTGLTEAQANLSIALELEKELRAAGAEVIMTRSDTANVPLNARAIIAKKANADLFVSIHNNAQPDGVNPLQNHGTATFFYQPQSMPMARMIQHELLKIPGVKDYGLYNGNLAVARATSYPSVLVECAFMILPEDEARLKTPEFRAELAKAITNGIREFLKSAADERSQH